MRPHATRRRTSAFALPWRHIDAFMENEVKPYAPDAYYNAADVVVGYELSFTKNFYKPVELRPIADITADINNIESSLKGVLDDILNV